MAKRKTHDEDIELGIVSEDITVENEAVITEEVPEEDTGTLTEATVTRVAGGEVWLYVLNFGYVYKPETIEEWMTRGSTAYVIHKGTPGKPDFEILGLIQK